MDPDTVIDMSDKNAWDDSLLIKSWDHAVAEYKKYHSIHKSGKRLEEVLTKEELQELQEDYGDVLEVTGTNPEAAGINGVADQQDADSSLSMDTDQAESAQNESETPEQNQQQGQSIPAQPTASREDPLAAAMPQAILGTVQDENLKNMMMSWYYAGYYTGVHAGQQQAPKHDSSRDG